MVEGGGRKGGDGGVHAVLGREHGGGHCRRHEPIEEARIQAVGRGQL